METKKTHFQDGIVTKIINKLASSILSFVGKVENVKGKALECTAVTLYFVFHIIMLFFHEPWFDEILAWVIARDSSLYEMLFVAPHYEGHPALWHLILTPFAKCGAPFELSISLVSLIFSGLAMALFVFKSPFKRIIRILMPFTYYLFYQYSVISRPYCIMMLAFVIMAMTFEKRNEKPGRFVLSLWFLCICSAYGIVIAGGICIAWLLEMFIEARKKAANKNSDNGENRGVITIFFQDYLIKNGKILWLAGLLGYVVFILIRIVPDDSAYAVLRATKIDADNGFLIRIIYTFFAMISDLVFTNVLYTTGTLRIAEIYYGELLLAAGIGIALLICLICYGMKKSTYKIQVLYFGIPYVLFSIFTAIVYLYYHHVGIVLLFAGFWLWGCIKCSNDIDNGYSSDKSSQENKPSLVDKAKKSGILKSFIVLALSMMLLLPLYWSVSSCIIDVTHDFGSGHMNYAFLKENGLDEGYTIIAEFGKLFKEENVPDEYSQYDLVFTQKGVSLEPYLEKSVLMDTPALVGRSYAYMHDIPNKEEMKDVADKLISMGKPDILVGEPVFGDLFEEEYVYYPDYTLVFIGRYGNIKKGVFQTSNSYIYVRNELAEELGIQKVSFEDLIQEDEQ